MPSRELSYPVFDADNHFYEPKEALTKFLPDHRKGVIDYIDVRGRTKIMVRNVVSDYIPTTPMNEGNINSHVVFGMNGRSIVDTMCDGRLLMKDRELIGIDEEAEMAKSRDLAQKMADRINHKEPAAE